MLLLGALVGSGSGPLAAQTDSVPVALRFLDVGQGDAVLITLGRSGVLIDAGPADYIVLDLAEYVDTLVAVVASHNHDDHIGGLDAVISDFPVRCYLGNGRAPASAAARNVVRWLTEKRVPRSCPEEPIRLGDVRLTVLRPPLDSARASENNSSLGVLVERGGFRALLTGDSEQEELGAWLAQGAIPDVDVLKAAHHGARNGLTPGWLDRTRPEVVVISVGPNGYGHPEPAALRYYELHHRRVYRTDRDGTVTMWIDRSGRYRIETAGRISR
jgi:beta-lactamase superfamily II metal-dependent hydrolase